MNRLTRRAGIDLITLSEITSIGDYNNNVDFELYNEAEVSRKSIERFVLHFLERSQVYSGAVYTDVKGLEVVKVIKNEVRSKRVNLKDKSFSRKQRVEAGGNLFFSGGMGEDSQGPVLRQAIPIFNDIGEFRGVIALDLDFKGFKI